MMRTRAEDNHPAEMRVMVTDGMQPSACDMRSASVRDYSVQMMTCVGDGMDGEVQGEGALES